LVYLIILQRHDIGASNGNVIGRILKEAVVTYFDIIPEHLPEEYGEKAQINRFPDRDLNPEPSEYEAILLTTTPLPYNLQIFELN
jgi:hypothetical protein